MQIIHSPRELAHHSKVCLAIGTFDGVHLGHQQVIRQAVADAEQHEALAVAVTFDRHPAAVVAPHRVPPLLYTVAQKLRAIASLRVDCTLLLEFTEAFSRQPGETFIRDLAAALHIHSITVGSTFTFGCNRDGNVGLLRRLGAELNFEVHGIAAVSLDSEPVSSTRIRESIRRGAFEQANGMLGRTYALCGHVERGDQMGRQIGFPTANLNVTGLVLPPNGVYAIHGYIGGIKHRGVLNIGVRPTLAQPEPQLRVEAHLLDFSGDLYGADMEVTFVGKLRSEERFPSLDALRVQIRRDVEAATAAFL